MPVDSMTQPSVGPAANDLGDLAAVQQETGLA